MPYNQIGPPLVPPPDVQSSLAAALPDSDMLALKTLFALRSGIHALDNVVSRWLGSDALSPGRWQVLAVLWSSGRPVPQHQIVQALKVSRANVSTLIEALKRDGHVITAADPTDGRQVLVSLTPAGRKLTDRLVRDTAGKLRRSLGLDDEDLRRLLDLMSRLLGPNA